MIRGALPIEKVNGIPVGGYRGMATHTPISSRRGVGIGIGVPSLPTFGTKTLTSGRISGMPVTKTSETFISSRSKSPITSRRYDASAGLLRGTNATGLIGGTFTGKTNIATVKDFRGTIMGNETQLKSGTVTNGGLVTSNYAAGRQTSVSASRRLGRTPLSRGLGTAVDTVVGGTTIGGGKVLTATAAEFILKANTTRNLPTRSVIDGTTDTKRLVTVGGMRTVDSGKLLLSTSTDKDRGIKVSRDIKVTSFGTKSPVASVSGKMVRSGIRSGVRSPALKSRNYFERVSNTTTSRPRSRVGTTTVGVDGRKLTTGVKTVKGATLAAGTTMTGNPVSVKRGNVVSSGSRMIR